MNNLENIPNFPALLPIINNRIGPSNARNQPTIPVSALKNYMQPPPQPIKPTFPMQTSVPSNFNSIQAF